MVCGFFGHRNVPANIENRLYDKIEEIILEGCDTFLIGSHGTFDSLALKLCCLLKEKYNFIKIFLVTTAISYQLNFKNSFEQKYQIISYPIENEYFLNQIWLTNKFFVHDCDIIICYIDFTLRKSGAKRAVNYAKRLQKRIINLYQNSDNFLYNLSPEEKEKCFQEFINA